MKQTIIVFVQDKPGVLNRISRHFYRLNYNIESITAGRSEAMGVTRITIVCNHSDQYNQSLIKTQLEELNTVLNVQDITSVPSIVREYALIKVQTQKEEKDKLSELIKNYSAKIIDSGELVSIIETTGKMEEVESLIKSIKQFKILEIMRSGNMAMVRVDQDEHRIKIEEIDKKKGWATQQISDALS